MVSSSSIIFILVIPTTCPAALIKAPPELPEFRAAVVWIRLISVPSSIRTGRSMAETMPSVMVPRSSSPRGLPMA